MNFLLSNQVKDDPGHCASAHGPKRFESRVLPVTRSIGDSSDRLSVCRRTTFSFWRPERSRKPGIRIRLGDRPEQLGAGL